MIVKIKSFALEGINGYPMDLEFFSSGGMPKFEIVGLASSAVKESRERVRAAITNSGFSFALEKLTVNLAPADTKKEGTLLDLPMAVGFLACSGQIPYNNCGKYVMIGELSLDGSLRHINGVMPMLISALQAGYTNFIIPYENRKEAAFIKGATVYAFKNLIEVTNFFCGIYNYEPIEFSNYEACKNVNKYGIDMADIRGQAVAKRALEIAVSGSHNILMNGSPGTGKTMLAKCVPTIMPRMTFEEALEVTKIHSIMGIVDPNEGIVLTRPFRSPHHTASLYSLTGGGTKSTPGEVSLAHNGVLFLDEMPEYSKNALETLRQPLEDGVITVSRVQQTVEYPAHFMLIASMNPCPCGYAWSKGKNRCHCTGKEKANYVSRLSGPLLDRIDIYVMVDNIEYSELRGGYAEESSEEVRIRVERARNIQLHRFKGSGIYSNSQMSNSQIKEYCALDEDSERLLETAFNNHSLSPRSASRILKVARTIADLSGADSIAIEHVAEAIQYKAAGKKELLGEI